MGHIGTRVDDEFERTFSLEAQSKGINKSDYLKEIVEARHELQFLKSNDGVLLVLTPLQLAKFEFLASQKSESVQDWIINILGQIDFDNAGNVCTDISVFQNKENGTQSVGKQLFTNVNDTVNVAVNACTQDNFAQTSENVHNYNFDLRDRFYTNPRYDLLSFEYVDLLLAELSENTTSDTYNAIDLIKRLLINAQNMVKYYYQLDINAIAELHKRQLNYMLYEGIKADEVEKVELFCEFLNAFK